MTDISVSVSANKKTHCKIRHWILYTSHECMHIVMHVCIGFVTSDKIQCVHTLSKSHIAGKKYWKISRVVKVITSKNIEFITSGRRP